MNYLKTRLMMTPFLGSRLGFTLTKSIFSCHYVLCLCVFSLNKHALICLNKGFLRLNGSSGGSQTPFSGLFRRAKSQFSGLKEFVFRTIGQLALLIRVSNERYKCQFQ